MNDWSKVPTFGVRPQVEARVIRPSAYALITDDQTRLAVVRTREGVFLPGGGIEKGEIPEEAIKRETLEECGLVIRAGAWSVRAVQFVYSGRERTYFEKRSIFINSTIIEYASNGLEAEHELVWVDFATATRILSHESHRWAVEEWKSFSLRR